MTPELRRRLIAWYCAAVGSICAMPWIATTLADAELEPGQIARAMLILPLAKLFASPGWSWAADRTDGLTVLRISTALAAVSGLALASAPTAPLLILAVSAVAITRAGIFPVADALTLNLLGADRRSYGQIRATGSMVFAVMMLTSGTLREVWPRGPLWLGAILVAIAAAISQTLPRPERTAQRAGLGDVLAAVKDPVLGSLTAVAVLHGLTLTTYDTLFPLHVEELGLSDRVAGTAVAVGVVVEVAVLWIGRHLLERIGPLPLLAIALASGIPRWWITGNVADPMAQIAAQSLHGLGFGAYWVAGVSLFNERAPASLGSTAQALLTVATFGVGYLLSMATASIVLQTADTSALYRLLVGVSCAATALLVVPWLAGAAERR